MSNKLTPQQVATLQLTYPPGALIYSFCTHVSKSGMQREFDYFVVANNFLQRVSRDFAWLLEYRYNSMECTVIVRGVGMDFRDEVVRQAATKLHGNRDAFDHKKM